MVEQKVYANDTFCLYLGLVLAFAGLFMVFVVPLFMRGAEISTVIDADMMGIALILLGISIQMMSFQRKGEGR